ncbi:SMAD/FHA domain-containing protein, partial [Mycena rebaudengoi]
MLRRRRSAGALVGTAGSAPTPGVPAPMPLPPSTTAAAVPPPVAPAATTANTGNAAAPTHRLRLVPHLDSRRSLRFDPIARDLRAGEQALRIGRFTDRSGLGLSAVNALSTNKIAFKSKVVSRAHAEVWVEGASGGGGVKFYIRDTKSSSGTFLNHVRLSPANTESRPHQIKDGDILQLGVDYQGGAEDIYKSVKIRIEVGREWQAGVNAFNTNALKNLKTLAIAPPAAGATAAGKKRPTRAGAQGASSIPDCCICLFPVSIRQALFIAPCSHTFHYKCLRPLLEAHHPAFSCPLCRTFADLEEDVE